MKVSWVLSEDIAPGIIEQTVLKEIAPSWGSFTTWNDYKTDNCISNDPAKISELIHRAFHAVCNFYIPKSLYASLGRPVGIKLFDGGFKDPTITNKDDIIALHLAASTSDIILLTGFNLIDLIELDDKARDIKRGLYLEICDVIRTYSKIQFVLVNYTPSLDDLFKDLPNLTMDTVDSVKQLLV